MEIDRGIGMLDETAISELYYKFIYIGIGVICLLILLRLIQLKIKGVIGKKKTMKSTIKGSGLNISKEPKGFIFGLCRKGLVYLRNINEGHITVFGGSGKGKTSAILIPTLRAWDSPFFAIDISGDISKNVPIEKEKKIILDPENRRESATYSPFFLVDKADTESEKRKRIEHLVNLIIEISPKANEAQMYFAKTGRKIFLASMIAFYDIGMDFIDICKTVFFSSMLELIDLVNATENKLASGYINQMLDENEKNVAGAKSTLDENIKLFVDSVDMQYLLKRSDENEISFSLDDLEEKRVFLRVSDVNQEHYKQYIHIIVAQLLEYILSRAYDPKTDNRILIAIDEFASIGYLNILAPFRKFRKNGANLCILTQSLADIDLVYSKLERQVILDNSKYVAILGAIDNSTREYFSQLIGKTEQVKTSVSTNQHGESKSKSESKEFIIDPEEWKDLGENIIVSHQAGFVRLKKNYYFKSKNKVDIKSIVKLIKKKGH